MTSVHARPSPSSSAASPPRSTTIHAMAPQARPNPSGRSTLNVCTNTKAGKASSACGRLVKAAHAAAWSGGVSCGTRTRPTARPSGTLWSESALDIHVPRRCPPPNETPREIPSAALCAVMTATRRMARVAAAVVRRLPLPLRPSHHSLTARRRASVVDATSTRSAPSCSASVSSEPAPARPRCMLCSQVLSQSTANQPTTAATNPTNGAFSWVLLPVAVPCSSGRSVISMAICRIASPMQAAATEFATPTTRPAPFDPPTTLPSNVPDPSTVPSTFPCRGVPVVRALCCCRVLTSHSGSTPKLVHNTDTIDHPITTRDEGSDM
mmetsp:Transcript_1051/g.3206  ORF Transcript_1051/g.3206 Transcript_1051/m.3206 type:complete len:324 (+) Transcript_1051:2895-3866(+)